MGEALISFLLTLGAGVVGGLILNIMPCVLPGLFMKARSVLMHLQGGQDLKSQRADGIAYLLGSLSTFSVYALVVIILRASGQSLGWGMQMQNPYFVGILLAMTFLFALSCFDLFEVNLGVNYNNSKYGPRLKSFIDGVFITLISTPCSAPILGGAVTVALANESAWWETLLLFWSIAFGLCLPILAISFFPKASHFVPRAGAWTEQFKYFVGWTLVGASVWLYTIYTQLIASHLSSVPLYTAALVSAGLFMRQARRDQSIFKSRLIFSGISIILAITYGFYQDLVPKDQAPRALYALCSIAMLAVLSEIWRNSSRIKAVALNSLSVAALAASLYWASQAPTHHLAWIPFEKAKLEAHLTKGHPSFVDFTADWCISCKTFEGLYLNTPSTAEDFERLQVLPLQVDLTSPDSPHWDYLKSFKRTGIPAYVLYHPDGQIEILPEGAPLSLHDRLIALEDKLKKTK
ncbi:MAG: hypothetical protein CMH49_00865 [Myxococcales bacterium]|nr:hypothetical protein [Myxococcales bacterium]